MSIMPKLRILTSIQQIFMEHLLCPRCCSWCLEEVTEGNLTSLYFRGWEERQTTEKYIAYEIVVSAIKKNEGGKEDKDYCEGITIFKLGGRERCYWEDDMK